MGNPVDDAVRAVIRGRKSKLDITVDELAERAGMSERTLARYLKGDSRLAYAGVYKLARALGTTVESIAAEAEDGIGQE